MHCRGCILRRRRRSRGIAFGFLGRRCLLVRGIKQGDTGVFIGNEIGEMLQRAADDGGVSILERVNDPVVSFGLVESLNDA